jgi:hypothetical protein
MPGRKSPPVHGRGGAQHWARRTKATHPLAVLQRQAVDVQHGVPAKATYKETFTALENRYGDHQLAAEYHSQLQAEIYLVEPARV